MDKEKIIAEFNRIRNEGYIPSRRAHNTGIGKTFEDYLGVDENNVKAPDFAGFEVKSQRTATSSFLTLFTKSPTHPVGVNALLRDSYGEEYEEYPGLKRLHTSIFANQFNTHLGRTGFRIHVDRNDERLVIQAKDLHIGTITDVAYWTYNDVKDCLNKKLKGLFFVSADSKIENGKEYFHYTKAEIYLNPSFDDFLNLIDNGKVMIDIRIGSYKSGRNKGKAHDHGTGFRIKPSDLCTFYAEKIIVE